MIAAAALKCMGGSLQGRLYPRSDDERQKAIEAGYDVTALLFQDDLCKGEQVRAWLNVSMPNENSCSTAHRFTSL